RSSDLSIAEGLDTTENQGYIINVYPNFPSITVPGLFIKTNQFGDTIFTLPSNTELRASDYQPIKFNKNYYLKTSPCPKNNLVDTILTEVTCISFDGNIKWSRRYVINGRSQFSLPKSIFVNENQITILGAAGNYPVATGQGGGGKFTILRIDTLGNEIMQKVYFANYLGSIDVLANAVQYNGSNFALYGHGASCCNQKPYILKTTNNLDTIQSKITYPSIDGDWFYPLKGNIIYANNNHFYISGSYGTTTSTNLFRSVLQKLDTSLNVKWTLRMGGYRTNTNRIFELENDTILLVTPESLTEKIWLFKILPSGDIIDSISLSSTVGGLGELKGAILKRNGELVICGEAEKNPSNLNSTGTAYISVIQLKSRPPIITEYKRNFVETLSKSSIIFFPNPTKEILNYESTISGELLLQDTSGKIVKDIGIRDRKGSFSVSHLSSGTYTYKFTTRNFMESGKVIVQ
ncbi:MAG: T9SS type A sorting domain-containing protein, partial [Cytophagales bacterium]|nr:T9SS type A sorting domain-containing protein [Cytophagales bacterium]